MFFQFFWLHYGSITSWSIILWMNFFINDIVGWLMYNSWVIVDGNQDWWRGTLSQVRHLLGLYCPCQPSWQICGMYNWVDYTGGFVNWQLDVIGSFSELTIAACSPIISHCRQHVRHNTTRYHLRQYRKVIKRGYPQASVVWTAPSRCLRSPHMWTTINKFLPLNLISDINRSQYYFRLPPFTLELKTSI